MQEDLDVAFPTFSLFMEYIEWTKSPEVLVLFVRLWLGGINLKTQLLPAHNCLLPFEGQRVCWKKCLRTLEKVDAYE